MIRLRQTSCVRWALLSAAAALAAAAPARADLATSSPFLPPGAVSGPGAGPADPVELRGIMALPEGMAYCIYDAAKKSSSWVGLNETGNEFVVKSADPATDSVMVTVQGRDLRLVLRASKVVSAGAGSAGSPVPPGVPGAPLLGGPSLNPAPGDEQRRLDAVATEVRRRRQERERAAQTGAPGAAVPPAPAPAAPNR